MVAGPASNGLSRLAVKLRNIARHIKKKKKLMMNEATRAPARETCKKNRLGISRGITK